MFFSISKSQDPRFFNHVRVHDFWFNHDNGWTHINDTWSKGYNYPDIDHGNFARIALTDRGIRLEHDRYRSFPLWRGNQDVLLTNLKISGESIWADDKVTVTAHGVETEKTDVIGTVSDTSLDRQCVIDSVVSNMQAKIQHLFENDPITPKKLFLSGGIDTTTLAAMCRDVMHAVELIDYAHFDYDDFTNRNIGDMVSQHPFDIRANHWAYRNAHHWREPTVLLTGSCGDEFAMRGPDSVAIWAAWHDLDLEKLLCQSRGYHVDYFLRPKNLKTIQQAYQQRRDIQVVYPTYQDLVRRILDVNSNDHQLWHLGNTTHWTPFKDLALLKLFLRLPYDDMISQIIDASVSKDIIARWNPALVDSISDSKNYIHRSNLKAVWD